MRKVMKYIKKELTVKIEELPFRAEDLGNSILLKIFGGECLKKGSSCDETCNNNCCGNLRCDIFVCV
jgi:hypothetical protein